MAIPASLLARLETQLEALDLVLARATPAALDARPRPGRVVGAGEPRPPGPPPRGLPRSACGGCLTEDRPALGRYRAEDDPEWPAWAALPPRRDPAAGSERSARSSAAVVRSLSPAESARTGLHPTFGEMDVAGWLDFFLLHEAHHLYTALVRVGEASRRPR